jgi:hypothetical protein
VSVRQRKLLRTLGPLARGRGFYLAGGTAVALHLGHRRSVDLDWLTGAAMGDPMLLAAACRESIGNATTVAAAPGTLHVDVSGIRVSFLEYHYPLLRETTRLEGEEVEIASLDDLACMKLSALVQRGARKDFLDVYALAVQHKPLRELLALYQSKYGLQDLGHLPYALSYFDDADKDRSPRMLRPLRWSEVRAAFVRWTQELAAM